MTKPIYEVIENETIKRIDADGKEWFIPMNEENSDYQAYLNKDKEVANEL
jgi:hypothetical protein